MRKQIISSFLLMLLMCAAAFASYEFKPRQLLAEKSEPLDLEGLIPKKFNDWRIDDSLPVVIPSEQTLAALNKIYNQTLARTYVNDSGQRVMLSIAYGGDQSDAMQAHMPEGCYEGQGFEVQEKSKNLLHIDLGGLPVSRMVAKLGQRNEPVTYWIVIGNRFARSQWEMKLVKLRYGFEGYIPEGMLVRVSSISFDADKAFEIQKSFSRDLIASVDVEKRARIFP